MPKYKYTMIVKKVVYFDEITVQVNAENETIAKKLAVEEAQYHNIIDVDKVKYKTSVFSHTCNPVEV